MLRHYHAFVRLLDTTVVFSTTLATLAALALDRECESVLRGTRQGSYIEVELSRLARR